MAQPQQNLAITAPGFAGLNTQDSPLSLDVSFASLATNCVIDQFGRISSRRGFSAVTQNPEILSGNPIEVLFEFITEGGIKYLFACGNNQIYLQDIGGTRDLTALTVPNAITSDNWQIASLNDKCYFVQNNHAPLVFDPAVSTTALAEWAETPSAIPAINYVGNPGCVHAAFGRLWTGDFDGSNTVVAYSSLLNGEDYTTGGAGSLETSEYWPSGYDQVTSLFAHNDFLIIFGQTNILVYFTTPDVAADLALVDTIEGLGCIARDSVVPIGKDIFFIDATGVRSLNRTIQEKSVPIGDISRNVRTDFQLALRNEPELDKMRGIFHVEDSFYACFLPNNTVTYVFDTWSPLPQGEARVTTWTNVNIRGGVRLIDRQTLFCGTGGVYQYTGASDIVLDVDDSNNPVETAIPMSYNTHPLDFDQPANLLFPKQVDVTLFGGAGGALLLNWGYDYAALDNTSTKYLSGADNPTEWQSQTTLQTTGGEWSDPINDPANNGQFGYWASVAGGLNQLKYNIWGSGKNIKLGFYTDVLGTTISIQELNLQVLTGRLD